MNTNFTPHALEDLSYLISEEPEAAERAMLLLKEISRTPFKGTGKPEPLRHDLKGWWSRRITGEHRLVYKVSGTRGVDQVCDVIQCRFHYDD